MADISYKITYKEKGSSIAGGSFDSRNDLIIVESAKNLGAEVINGGSGNDELRLVTESRTSETYILSANITNIEKISIAEESYSDTPDTSGDTQVNLDASKITNALSIYANDGGDNIVGTNFNDTIIGGAGNDTITGGLGNDSLQGGYGNDIFILKSFADYASSEYLDADDLTDTLLVNDTVSGSLVLGANVIDFENITIGTLAKGKITSAGTINLNVDASATTGNLNIVGNAGNNSLSANNSGNSLQGGLGKDTLNGGDGSDSFILNSSKEYVLGESLNGGIGADTLYLGGAGVYKFATDGDLQAIESIIFGSGKANITIDLSGQSEEFYVSGNQGKNVITTGAGSDNIYTGSPDDTNDDKINAGTGNNYIEAGSGKNSITSGDGNDNITAYDGDDTITDAGGNNTIFAGNGKNTITAGAGSDTITTYNGDDKINAGAGNNFINAGNGKNTITSLGGNDGIQTGKGNDSINAGDGQNTIRTGAGNDVVTTGNGNDTIYAGQGNDTVNGGIGSDVIYADRGDTIASSATGNGIDNLSGGNGGDIFVIDHARWAAKDVINGGSDYDTLIFAETNDFANSADAIFKVDSARISDIEEFYIDNDTNFGNEKGTANVGLDLSKYNSDATIYGNDGNNVLIGGKGDDYFRGMLGADTITGGAGNDTFIFYSISEDDADRITDFVSGSDKINVYDSVNKFAVVDQETHINITYDADGVGIGAAVVIFTLEGVTTSEFNINTDLIDIG